jgi:hypothetical protein
VKGGGHKVSPESIRRANKSRKTGTTQKVTGKQVNYLASVPWGYARQTVHPQWWQPQDDPCKRQKCSNDVLSALNNKKQARVFFLLFSVFYDPLPDHCSLLLLPEAHRKREKKC